MDLSEAKSVLLENCPVNPKTSKSKILKKAIQVVLENNVDSNKISVEEATILIFALRYAISRLSYAPGLTCDYIINRIPCMNKTQLENFIEEIDEDIRLQLYADDIALASMHKLKQTLMSNL